MSHTSLHGVFRGIVAGMIGGAAGSWMMNHMDALKQAEQKAAAAGRSAVGSRAQAEKQASAAQGSEEPTVKVAQKVSRQLFDHELNDTEKQIAGPAVHYGYGMMVGGLYGGLAELWPNVKIGFGMGYGIALWALGDEAVLPALRLTPPPTQIPMEKHADTLATHVCFGLTLDCVRRISKVFL